MTNDHSRAKKRKLKKRNALTVLVQHIHTYLHTHAFYLPCIKIFIHTEQFSNVRYRANLEAGTRDAQKKGESINHLENSTAIAFTNLQPSIICAFFVIPNNTSLCMRRKLWQTKNLNVFSPVFVVDVNIGIYKQFGVFLKTSENPPCETESLINPEFNQLKTLKLFINIYIFRLEE